MRMGGCRLFPSGLRQRSPWIQRGVPPCSFECGKTLPFLLPISHRIHGAGVYANIWGIFMVNVTSFVAYMDPMGLEMVHWYTYQLFAQIRTFGACVFSHEMAILFHGPPGSLRRVVAAHVVYRSSLEGG